MHAELIKKAQVEEVKREADNEKYVLNFCELLAPGAHVITRGCGCCASGGTPKWLVWDLIARLRYFCFQSAGAFMFGTPYRRHYTYDVQLGIRVCA